MTYFQCVNSDDPAKLLDLFFQDLPGELPKLLQEPVSFVQILLIWLWGLESFKKQLTNSTTGTMASTISINLLSNK